MYVLEIYGCWLAGFDSETGEARLTDKLEEAIRFKSPEEIRQAKQRLAGYSGNVEKIEETISISLSIDLEFAIKDIKRNGLQAEIIKALACAVPRLEEVIQQFMEEGNAIYR